MKYPNAEEKDIGLGIKKSIAYEREGEQQQDINISHRFENFLAKQEKKQVSGNLGRHTNLL